MPLKTEAIQNILKAWTLPDLAALYNYNMECQVNVIQGNGKRIDGEYKGKDWHGYTDGVQTWKPIRIPYNAGTDATYEDSPISFDLARHAEGIGMTGWDWKNRCSRWVAYDFDAITGHSSRHTRKSTDVELQELIKLVQNIPWVTIRRSTSGKGFHFYVFLEGVPTQTHTEHAALARAILGKLSALTGFDFSSKVDVLGGNMWVWHRKMKGTEGLTIIKEGTILKEIPENWREHKDVILGKRKKALPKEISESKVNDIDTMFEELTGQLNQVPLDDEHKKLIDYLEKNHCHWWWDNDHHALVTHTIYLKEAHESLGMRGVFETNSKGSERGIDHNCFGAETLILTKEGPKTLKELEGTKPYLYVKTEKGFAWIQSEILNFGKQKLHKIGFGDGSSVRATEHHQWLYYQSGKINLANRIATYQLQPNRTQLPLAEIELPIPDPKGIAHGFVYGDGWVSPKSQDCDVAFFKNDKDLFKIICQFGRGGSFKTPTGEYIPCVRGLPSDWKHLPTDCTKEYAMGFIIGLISADGFVSTNLMIQQSDYSEMLKIRNLALFAGFRCNPMCHGFSDHAGTYKNAKPFYKFSIDSYNVRIEHLIRRDQKKALKVFRIHKHRYVLSVDREGIVEDVYCAVVPFYNNFTLANGVVTGNCFCHNRRGGAWTIRRFTPGVEEARTWTQDGKGWTTCLLNQKPDLATASRCSEGLEHPSGGYIFQQAEDAIKAALMLGIEIKIPTWAAGKETKIKEHKDGRMIIEMDKEDKDRADEMRGWLPDKGKWKRIFELPARGPKEIEVGNYDDLIRHIVTLSGEDSGWKIKSMGTWKSEPLVHIQKALKSMGLSGIENDVVIGSSILKCWTLVNLPFQPEYPGDRQWNLDAPQLRFLPSEGDNRKYPHWLKLLNHCGESLDEAVLKHDWCKTNNILTGADYLKIWISSMFQYPGEPLPYLFFHGPQNSGKTMFHESIGLLLSSGCARADNALINSQGFNGELIKSVIAVTEETDLRKNKVANNRIKDWVTALQLQIHPKGGTPYTIPNTTHWLQTANDINYCPVFPGDTRIVVCYVNTIKPTDMIPKKRFLNALIAEAPDFVAEILKIELPEPVDRLYIPVVTTDDKIMMENANRSPLEVFITEKCFHIPGETILYGEFAEQFIAWLDPEERMKWPKIRVGKELPRCYPKGRSTKNAHFIVGNISFYKPMEDRETKPRLVPRGEFLVEEGKEDGREESNGATISTVTL